MPILSLDKKGNIVQTDSRFNGTVGIGAVADMVDQGDVTELSLSPEQQSKMQRDRAALRQLELKSKKAKIRKWAEDVQKQKKKEQARAAYLEKQYIQKKKENYLAQLYKNTAYMVASQKPGVETMSGVSGFGFSADGRQPVLVESSQDWQPIMQANVAFGGDAENWGNDTGIGQHSNDEVKKHGFGGLVKHSAMGDLTYDPELVQQENFLRKSNNPINEAAQSEIINESVTNDDDYALRQFLDNSYVVKVYDIGHQGTAPVNKLVIDDHIKNQINSFNNSWGGAFEMSKVIAQGWGYSILDDGKTVRLVKIPYYYGLPMYVPDNTNNMYTAKYVARSAGFPWSGRNQEFRNGAVTNPDYSRPTYFQALYPVILAAAKEFAQHSDEFGVWKGREWSKVVTKEAKAQSSGGGGSFIKKLFSQGSPNFQHPLLKQGLLK